MLLETLFVLALLVFIYVYFLYPLILSGVDFIRHGKPLNTNFSSKILREKIETTDKLRLKHGLPTVTVIIPCYNEIDAIEGKIKNLKDLNYPEDKITFLFVDDLSNDGTRGYLNKQTDSQIKVHFNQTRLGKLEGMKAAASGVKSDLILFSDCAARINSSAVKKMVRYFRNSATGLVTGVYKVVPLEKSARSNGEGLYWKYEMAIRKLESHLRTTTHATGSIFMVRNSLFQKIEWYDGIINDDFFIPLSIIEMGFDVHAESKAVATEYVESNVSGEFKRRSRIASGNFQMVSEVIPLIKSKRYFTIFQLLSHKLLRNAAGVLLPFILIANIALLNNEIFMFIFAMQILFYATAALGLSSLGKKGKLKKITAIPLYFTSSNIASAYGLFLFLSKKQKNIWNSTDQVYGGVYGLSNRE